MYLILRMTSSATFRSHVCSYVLFGTWSRTQVLDISLAASSLIATYTCCWQQQINWIHTWGCFNRTKSWHFLNHSQNRISTEAFTQDLFNNSGAKSQLNENRVHVSERFLLTFNLVVHWSYAYFPGVKPTTFVLLKKCSTNRATVTQYNYTLQWLCITIIILITEVMVHFRITASKSWAAPSWWDWYSDGQLEHDLQTDQLHGTANFHQPARFYTSNDSLWPGDWVELFFYSRSHLREFRWNYRSQKVFLYWA